jgi:Protein of unknown function (DUF1553)/Protein of unknown function (DUF1549)
MPLPLPIRRFCLLAVLVLAARGAAQDPPEGQKHWAFRPLTRPDPPPVADPARARTPVDRFLLARLDAAKLSFAPEADRATLIRRASLDLVGLPPSPDEVAAFVADPAPDAFERLIDRLLASPHFGERWGRHWLDGAGYVDVTGGDNDAGIIKLGQNKWLYRDYVIRSFNADKPFDRFLTEQLAGDELVNWRETLAFTPEIRDALIATGFLRTAADDTDENELNTLDIRHGVLQRTAEVLANNLLGLTLNCAKCHDHKYEPLSQKDYYGFLALLQPAFNPDHWLQPKQRLLAAIPPAEKKAADEHNSAIDKQIADANKHKLEPDAQKKKLAELNAKRRTYDHWQVVYDVGPPTPTRLLRRGDHTAPGTDVEPGFPGVLCASPRPRFGEGVGAKGSPLAGSSNRRLALARWLTDDTTPARALVLRVRVNRVWRHLFGRGLVEPADNFGLTGEKPTHLELLDWLATELARSGGRLKPFLRLVMTSAAYRQASAVSGPSPVPDPDNRLLGRMPLRRLESEVIRDSILAASGMLDQSLGGPPVPVDVKPDGSLAPRDGDRPRRSVYLLARRNYHPTLLGVFDQPVLTTNCTGRQTSAVVLQALTMLNDEFIRTQAATVADRAAMAKPSDETDAAFRLVLGRPPTATEAKVAANLLAAHRARGESPRQALAHLCHVLLNTSEFLYAP